MVASSPHTTQELGFIKSFASRYQPFDEKLEPIKRRRLWDLQLAAQARNLKLQKRQLFCTSAFVRGYGRCLGEESPPSLEAWIGEARDTQLHCKLRALRFLRYALAAVRPNPRGIGASKRRAYPNGPFARLPRY